MTQLPNYEHLPTKSLSYPSWIISSLHSEFPEIDRIRRDREALDTIIEDIDSDWTDYFAGSTIQTILKWINPEFTARATSFILTIDRICRDEIPVIHIGCLFIPSVSFYHGFSLFSQFLLSEVFVASLFRARS